MPADFLLGRQVQASSSADSSSTYSPSTDPPGSEPRFLGCRTHFWDFCWLLEGFPIKNPQLALETMAVSIEKVFGKNCHPAVHCGQLSFRIDTGVVHYTTTEAQRCLGYGYRERQSTGRMWLRLGAGDTPSRVGELRLQYTHGSCFAYLNELVV
jgi:hypothetical protein